MIDSINTEPMSRPRKFGREGIRKLVWSQLERTDSIELKYVELFNSHSSIVLFLHMIIVTAQADYSFVANLRPLHFKARPNLSVRVVI